MAGDWIPMRLDLAEDPAVIGVATALDIKEAEVVGHLHRLWGWANRHTRDGNAGSVTKTWIDRYIGVTGFAAALESEGWLAFENGGVSIPLFDRYNSQSAKSRMKTAVRVDRHRNGPGVTKALPEKRREEKIDSASLRSAVAPDHNGRSTKRATRNKPAPKSRHHKPFIDWWAKAFEKAKAEPYGFDGGKDGAAVSAILKLAGGSLKVAQDRAITLLESNDRFYVEKGIDLGTLRNQWNRLGSAGKGKVDLSRGHVKAFGKEAFRGGEVDL